MFLVEIRKKNQLKNVIFTALQLCKVLPGPKTFCIYLQIGSYIPRMCYFWRQVSYWAGVFAIWGGKAGSEGREVGNEVAGSGHRRGGKRRSSTPCLHSLSSQ